MDTRRTALDGRIVRHDAGYGLSSVQIADGELRVPMIDRPVDAAVTIAVDARDVSLALTRPMDISITNRLPGRVASVEALEKPYACVTVDLGHVQLASLVTIESVERLALEPGVAVWAMIKAVAIGPAAIGPGSLSRAPTRRPWPPG